MCGGGQDYSRYLMETGRRIQLRFQNPSARTAIELATNTGSIRAVQALGRLLERSPFSNEEQMYRAITHLQPREPKTPMLDVLRDIVEASGEEAEQVLEQIEIMCARGLLNGNAYQRLVEILNAVRAGGSVAVSDLRKSWES